MNEKESPPQAVTSQLQPAEPRKYSMLGIAAFAVGLWHLAAFGLIFLILQFFYENDALLLLQGFLQLCLAIFPFVGILLGIGAVLFDIIRKTRCKAFSIIGLALNVLIFIGYYAILIIGILTYKGPL